MRWPFSKKPEPLRPAMLPADRAKVIRSMAAHLETQDLINCIVTVVSDRSFTADQRSRLFLRLGGVVVASTPRPDQ
jgi:hypothetical protein